MDSLPEVGFRQRKALPRGIEIFDMESLRHRFKKTNHDPLLPHKVTFNTMMFVTGGEGKHYIDFTTFNLKSGDLIFISRGAVQQFDRDFGMNGWVVLFTDDFLKQNLLLNEMFLLNFMFEFSHKTRIVHLEGKDEQFYKDHLNYMMDEFSFPIDPGQNKILYSYLKILLVKAVQIIEGFNNKNDRNISLMFKLNELIEKYGKKERSAIWYAEKTGVTYKVLNNTCVKLLNQTLKWYLSSNIILQIQRELATSDLSFKELSWEFNFDEPTNFTKFYKRYAFGETPKEFRTKIMGSAE